MKNSLLLLVFFATIGCLFALYFVPNINQENDVDFLEKSLSKVLKIVPETETVYFFSESLPNATETYYKTEMIMAPRIIIQEDINTIPKGQFILTIQDKNGKNTMLESVAFLKETDFIVDNRNDFYHITLLKKK